MQSVAEGIELNLRLHDRCIFRERVEEACGCFSEGHRFFVAAFLRKIVLLRAALFEAGFAFPAVFSLAAGCFRRRAMRLVLAVADLSERFSVSFFEAVFALTLLAARGFGFAVVFGGFPAE